MKVCSKCNIKKELSCFYRNKQQKSGFHPSCKVCAKKVSAEWRARTRDVRLEKQRNYRRENIEEIRRKDRKRSKCPKRKAYKNARQRYYLVKHRSLDRSFMEEVELIYRVASYLSSYDGRQYEVDHIIPLQGQAVSGLHVPWNLQIIDRFENRSKGNKL